MHLICKIDYGILIYRIKGGGNMEFLYKLYSNNYFGIGLFIVITILAFAFLVILFFGKKDEKARIAEEKELEKKTNVENTEAKEEVPNDTLEAITLNEEPSLKTEEISSDEEIALEEPTEDEPIFESESVLDDPIIDTQEEEPTYFEETPKEEMDPFVTSNIVLNTDYIMDEEPEMEKIEEDLSKTSDIYNLNSLIQEEIPSNDEETIDDVLNKYDAIEETVLEEPVMETPEEENAPIVEENEVDVFTRPDDSIKKASTPFSSVYLTKEEAETKKEEEVEEPKPAMPSRTAFDLPKRVDLPKRSAGAINESIITSLREDRNNNQE